MTRKIILELQRNGSKIKKKTENEHRRKRRTEQQRDQSNREQEGQTDRAKARHERKEGTGFPPV